MKLDELFKELNSQLKEKLKERNKHEKAADQILLLKKSILKLRDKYECDKVVPTACIFAYYECLKENGLTKVDMLHAFACLLKGKEEEEKEEDDE